MSKMKNILITTLGYTKNHLHAEYYSYRDEKNEIKFCTGISGAEAGTKLILSEYDLDEILVIGAPGTAGSESRIQECLLSDCGMLDSRKLEEVSEFEFYLYRIMQYVSRIDIETDDILYDTTDEKRQEFKKRMDRCLKYGANGRFYYAATDAGAYKKFLEVVSDMDNDLDICRLKHMMYLDMDSVYKMHALESNKEVKIKFLPVKKDGNGNFIVEDMVGVADEVASGSNMGINIHIDLQGMEKADSYMMWSMLSIVCSSNTNLNIRTVIRSHSETNSFINSIDNEIGRYDIELLLSGMRAFLQYGKVEIIEEYCISHKINHPVTLKLVNAMKYVDAGVSLCNMSDLKYGIQALKSIFCNADVNVMEQNDVKLFSLLRKGIRKDYGALLEGDDVNIPELIDWAQRKHFYQQALTMIESLVPADMVRRGIYYYAKEEPEIEKVLKNWNVLFWNEIPKNRYFFNDPDHFFIKSYGKSAINFRQPKDKVCKDYAKLRVELLAGKHPELCRAYSALDNNDMLYELLLSYYDIGNIRNQVSHAQASEHALQGLEEMMENKDFELLRNSIGRFLDIYKEACREVNIEGREPKLIDAAKLKAYTGSHRLQPLAATDENLLLTNTYNCQFNGQDINIEIHMLGVKDSLPGD